jgi:type II secretory pathway pseudopilin PulG
MEPRQRCRLHRPRGGPAVTLTELLVVLAVIALLVAVMAPMAKGGRDRVMIVVCANRLRGAGCGLAVYGAENAGHYPVGETPFDVPQVELVSALSAGHVPSGEVFYCPSETDPQLQYSEERLQEAWIGYFYYSCRNAAPYRSSTSKVLRNFGALTPNWPRKILTLMPSDTWVMSDRWIAGQAAHPVGRHGMNRLALDGSVVMVANKPAGVFR